MINNESHKLFIYSEQFWFVDAIGFDYCCSYFGSNERQPRIKVEKCSSWMPAINITDERKVEHESWNLFSR